MKPLRLFPGCAAVLLYALHSPGASAQPLSSWNDGPARQAIVEFVTDVTAPGAQTDTDAHREHARDRQSRIGKVDKGLDDAPAKDRTVVDMKKYWNRAFAFQ